MKKITVLCFFLWSGIISQNLMAETIDIFASVRIGDTVAIKQYLTEKGDANIKNTKSYTPFILAAYYAQIPALEILLAAGADPCAVDNKGSNAFMGVAFKGHKQVAKWLLENTQCDVNHQNYAGQTTLMMASLFGRKEMIKLLLEQGANKRLEDKQGNSAITLAQAQGLSRVVEIIQFHLQ